MIVSVYLPNGYATPEEFARDCGVELVGQPCSVAGSARRLAEHFGYDWSTIDSYRTGACLIPSSQTNDEMCARADFMKIAKIVLSPSEEQSDRRSDAPVSGQSGEGGTPGDAIVRAGTPGTGENFKVLEPIMAGLNRAHDEFAANGFDEMASTMVTVAREVKLLAVLAAGYVEAMECLVDLVTYGDHHNWGTMPEGSVIARAQGVAKQLCGVRQR